MIGDIQKVLWRSFTDTPPSHPAPHTCFPAWSVAPHRIQAASLVGGLQAHLFQEAVQAHLAESSPSLDVDLSHFGAESFGAMASNHVKNHLRALRNTDAVALPPSIKLRDGARAGVVFKSSQVFLRGNQG